MDIRFKSIAGDVLRIHSKDFLEDFKKDKELYDLNLSNKEQNINKTIEGVNKSMKQVENKIIEFEKQQGEQLGALGESIKHVLNVGIRMHEEAGTLKAVLSSASAVRGSWGEAVLKNLLEDSGLTEGIDFSIQESISGGEGASLRPDIIINLPGGLRLAIDSKASLEEFFKAAEEKEEGKKSEHLLKFTKNIRGRIQELSSKEYQKYLDQRIPYVVMFIPGEAAVRAAFEHDTSLYREAQERKVMIASPTTMIPLIFLIAHAWRQQKSIENVTKFNEEVFELGNRIKTFFGYIVGIGSNLSQTTKKNLIKLLVLGNREFRQKLIRLIFLAEICKLKIRHK